MSAAGLMFLGPPGSGKGTQAGRLAERLGLVQLSSGDALRRERAEGSEIGRKAAQYMDAGTLVPDEVITGVMLAAIDKLPAGTGFHTGRFPAHGAAGGGVGRGPARAEIDDRRGDRLQAG